MEGVKGFKAWLADFPTAALVVVAAVLWSTLAVVVVLVCFAVGRVIDDGNLNATYVFLASALGVSAAYFAIKRKTWDPEKQARADRLAADCAPSLADTATHRTTPAAPDLCYPGIDANPVDVGEPEADPNRDVPGRL